MMRGLCPLIYSVGDNNAQELCKKECSSPLGHCTSSYFGKNISIDVTVYSLIFFISLRIFEMV